MVDDGIVAGIVGRPFVDVVADGLLSAEFQGTDGEDARACATIEDSFVE